MAGILSFVAVPIGHARDITLRALDLLASADVLAAEDTRALKRLMEIHGIELAKRKIWAYHEHSGDKMRAKLLDALERGQHVAYASEAGTPLISDPGFELGRAARAAGHKVEAAPGASAVLTALTVGGLPTDRFFFAGFLPQAASGRRRALRELAEVPGTLAIYEAPHRIAATLADACDALGDREAALCRELTKTFEEVRQGRLSELMESVHETPPKGEIVLLIARAPQREASEGDIDAALRDALQDMSLRDASAHVAEVFAANKRKIYQRALAMSKSQDE